MPPILCLLYYFGLPLPDKIFSGGSAIDSFHFSTFNPILLRIPTLDFLQPQWQVSNCSCSIPGVCTTTGNGIFHRFKAFLLTSRATLHQQ